MNEGNLKVAEAVNCSRCDGFGRRFGVTKWIRCEVCKGAGELFFGDPETVLKMRASRVAYFERFKDPEFKRQRMDPGPRRRRKQRTAA